MQNEFEKKKNDGKLSSIVFDAYEDFVTKYTYNLKLNV